MFRRKILSIAAAVGAVIAVMSMTSCAMADIKTEYALLRQEWGEIKEFIGERQWSSEPSKYAVADTPDMEIMPLLGMTPHTELLDTSHGTS